MSDLHQAVQAEIAAHTPVLQPSFDALKARKRSRDRRRITAAAAASALAVAGIAFVPSALLNDDDRGRAPGQVAQDAGDPEVFAFYVKAADGKTVIESGPDGHEAIQRCTELPGLSDTNVLYSDPAQYAGRVTGRDSADALTDCVEAVPGWDIALTPVAPAEETRTYTVQPSVRTVMNTRLEEQRDACFALPGVEALDVDESLPLAYRVTVPASGAEAFERCIRAVVGLYVPELDKTHAVSVGIKAPPPVRIERTDDFGRITDIFRNGTSLRVERVDMLSGQEAEQAAAEAGADLSNDYFLRQRPEAWTTHTLDPSVVVWASIRMAGSVEPVRVDLARLIEFIDQENASEDPALFHLHVEAGRVVGIEEQYRP